MACQRFIPSAMRPTGKLIFATPIDALNGQTLFKNAGDLAAYAVQREIIRDARSKNHKMLATYLAQVLVYEDPRRSRPLSDPLNKEVLIAIRQRMAELNVDEDQFEEWSRRFSHAVELDTASRAEPSPLNADHLWYEMLELTQTTSEQFIVTFQPAEVVRSPRAQALRDLLLNRLGLDRLAHAGVPQARCKYTFNLPSAEVCTRFWHRLARAVEQHPTNREHISRETVKAALDGLVQSEHLVVQQIPQEMCVIPTAVFDPDDDGAKGFNLYYHGEHAEKPLVSIAKLDPRTLDWWHSAFYLPIKKGTTQGVNRTDPPTTWW